MPGIGAQEVHERVQSLRSAALSQKGDVHNLTSTNLLGPTGNHNQTVRLSQGREQMGRTRGTAERLPYPDVLGRARGRVEQHQQVLERRRLRGLHVRGRARLGEQPRVEALDPVHLALLQQLPGGGDLGRDAEGDLPVLLRLPAAPVVLVRLQRELGLLALLPGIDRKDATLEIRRRP